MPGTVAGTRVSEMNADLPSSHCEGVTHTGNACGTLLTRGPPGRLETGRAIFKRELGARASSLEREQSVERQACLQTGEGGRGMAGLASRRW